MTTQDKEPQSFELQLNSPKIKAVMVYTNQALNFRMKFCTALSISTSTLKVVLRPLKNGTPLDFIKAQTHLHYLNGMTVGECHYYAREAN